MTAHEPPLSTADLEFWRENGYVVERRAVPPEHCRAAEAGGSAAPGATPTT